tara:strand:+ start:585 stop:704 length:120 start_codon:yes stop_codon:yes gene_type:complete
MIIIIIMSLLGEEVEDALRSTIARDIEEEWECDMWGRMG